LSDLEDLSKAQKKINHLISLGKEISLSAPTLLSLNQSLLWYAKASQKLGDDVNLIQSIKPSIDLVNEMDISQFKKPDASGSYAFVVSGTAASVNIIKK